MVMSIETAFADISDQMTWIDNKKLVMDEEGYPMQFAPQWRALHHVCCFGIVIIQTNFTSTL
jgi:hypothetical protein